MTKASAVRRAAVVAGAVVLGAVLLGALYLVHLVRSVDTPAFRRSLLDRASAAAGTKVEARVVEVSLWHGLTLRGVTVANPRPFPGDLLTAEAFVLRYRLRSLLAGRMELSRLSLEKPVLTLAMDARGALNYERLGGARASGPGQGSSLPVALVLSKLSVEHGRVVVRDPRSALLTIEGADLDSALVLSGASIEGKGKVRVALANVGDSLFVRDIGAPLEASKGGLVLAPLEGTLAKGKVRGDVRVQLRDTLRFTANVTVEGAQLQKLLEEAKATQSASGRLNAQATVEGTGGVATLKGRGRAQVSECAIANAPVLTLLSTVLRIPELAHPELDECLADFTLGNGRLTTPSVRLKGRSMQLTGRGVVRLDTLALDYDMTLALDKTLLERIPVREVRAGFVDRADGFAAIDFTVAGTTTAPTTDLTTRLGKAAAVEAVQRGLKGWLRKRKIL
jgi:AsmA-like C-terminal region